MKKYYFVIALLIIFTIVFTQTNKYIVDPKTCIGCTLCVIKCPVKAIEMKENKAVIDVSKCIGCGLCAANCPVKAISIIKAVEPQVSAADSIKKAIPDSVKKELNLKLPDKIVAPKDSTIKTLPDSLKKESKPKVTEPEKKKDAQLLIPEKSEITSLPAQTTEIKPQPVTDRVVYKVDENNCIGCKICISKCPVDAIDYKKNAAVIDPKKCIGCGLCAAACPVKAIAKV